MVCIRIVSPAMVGAGLAVQKPCGVEIGLIATLKRICYCCSVLLTGAGASVPDSMPLSYKRIHRGHEKWSSLV